ncbi:hypothetical protein NE237_022825 [Protea cynaroides]|uniref:Ubiquitin-like domain-containing protein n=1 Tax=Protea cynaroides TaxID=273540 RepID=A0A9Q0HAC9_9MAGN|nr:hypothetical protein NE237_022825 [Protea cynaroides]
MLISIETEYSVFHKMRVWPSSTVLELKEKMEMKSSAKADQQVLWLDRIKLKDEKTLDYYGIRDGMELYMTYNYFAAGVITISAKTETKTYNLEVEETDNVLVLKGRIYQLSGIPIELMKLFCGETKMENNKSLLAYYIREGSIMGIVGVQNVADD